VQRYGKVGSEKRVGGLPSNWGSRFVEEGPSVHGGADQASVEKGGQEIIIDLGNPQNGGEYQQIFLKGEGGEFQPVLCSREEVSELLRSSTVAVEGNSQKCALAVPSTGEAHQSGKAVTSPPSNMTSQQPAIMTSQQPNKLIKIDIKKPVNRKRPITATVVGRDNKKSQYQIMKVPEPPVNSPASQPEINSPAPNIARKSSSEEDQVKSMSQIFMEEEFPAEIQGQQFGETPFPSFGVTEDLKPQDVPQIFDPQMDATGSIFNFNDEFQAGEIPKTADCFPGDPFNAQVNIDDFLQTPSPKSSATSSVDTSEWMLDFLPGSSSDELDISMDFSCDQELDLFQEADLSLPMFG